MERKCKAQTIVMSIPEKVKKAKEYKEILENASYVELIKNKEEKEEMCKVD